MFGPKTNSLDKIFNPKKLLVKKKGFGPKQIWSDFFLFSTVKSPNKNLNSTKIQRLTKLNTLDLSLVVAILHFQNNS